MSPYANTIPVQSHRHILTHTEFIHLLFTLTHLSTCIHHLHCPGNKSSPTVSLNKTKNISSLSCHVSHSACVTNNTFVILGQTPWSILGHQQETDVEGGVEPLHPSPSTPSLLPPSSSPETPTVAQGCLW